MTTPPEETESTLEPPALPPGSPQQPIWPSGGTTSNNHPCQPTQPATAGVAMPAPLRQVPAGDLLTLRDVRAEFPDFAIWREVTKDTTRYHAQRAHDQIHPYSLITTSLDELRAKLAGHLRHRDPSAPAGTDTSVANIARMYDYWLGGKSHYAADRKAANTITQQFPEVAALARANRRFVTHAVAHAAAHGVSQFIDIGAGLPTSPNVHQTARQAVPEARVAYLDNDQVVLAHARALLATTPGVAAVDADMRDPAALLASPDLHQVIDLDQPVGLLLASVLHFAEPEEADTLVTTLSRTVVPGSFLIISAGTCTGTDPALIARARLAYAGASAVTARPEQDIMAWFTGWCLVPPGLVDVRDWQPHLPHHRRHAPQTVRFLAGIGRRLLPAL